MCKKIKILLLALLMGTSSFVCDAATDIEMENVAEEELLTDFSQNAIKLLYDIRMNDKASDENKIRETIDLFMEIKRNQLENYDSADFDFTVFSIKHLQITQIWNICRIR